MSRFLAWWRKLAEAKDRRNEAMVQGLAGRQNYVVVRFDDPIPWPQVASPVIGWDIARGDDITVHLDGGENYRQRIERERKDR